MDRTTLSEQDIDILLDAMKAWETKGTMSGFGGAMLGAMLSARDPGSDPRGAMERTMDEGREEDRKNAEVAILIKAKLIHMKREAQSRADMSEAPVGRFDR